MIIKNKKAEYGTNGTGKDQDIYMSFDKNITPDIQVIKT